MFTRPRTLFFRAVPVGTVTPTGSDMPWAWGTFARTLDPADTLGDRGRVLRYIDYCLEADAVRADSGDAAWEAFVVAHDEQFMDLMDGGWRLVAADGDEWPASVVTFNADGTVGWR